MEYKEKLEQMLDALKKNRVVTAVKDDEGVRRCLEYDSPVFVLYGTVTSILGIVDRLKSRGRIVIVHIDLIGGLASTLEAVAFIKNYTRADGIISTKPSMVKAARDMGLIAIQRLFLLDSQALKNCKKCMQSESVDIVEVLPGCMPKIIREISSYAKVPLIVGGLLSNQEDCRLALQAGAIAVSTTNPDIWQL